MSSKMDALGGGRKEWLPYMETRGRAARFGNETTVGVPYAADFEI